MAGGATIPLDIGNITELVVPNMAVKWFEMGLRLGVNPKELTSIENDAKSSKKACIKMFTEWLAISEPPKSWEILFSALCSQSVRENSLAQELRGKIRAVNKPSDGGIGQKITSVDKVASGKEADAEVCSEVLSDHYDKLITALPVVSLLPKFISGKIVSFRDQDKILAGETDEEKRIRFLKHITNHLSSGNTDSFYRLLEIVKKHGGSYSYLASNIEKRLAELQEETVTTTPGTVQDSEPVHYPVQVEPSEAMESTEMYSVLSTTNETSGEVMSTVPRNYQTDNNATQHDGAKPVQSQNVPQAPPPPLAPAQAELKLFISYGREEITNTFALTLCSDLERQGWKVFLDVHDIDWGDPIARTISDAIHECHAMIVIFTQKYDKSEWCQKELEYASSEKKKLFPLRRQNIPYPPLLGFHIGHLRWLDVFTDDQYNAVLKDIIKTLKKLEKEVALPTRTEQ